jgi:hypothetical protein
LPTLDKTPKVFAAHPGFSHRRIRWTGIGR